MLILRFSTICNRETLCKINRDYFEDIIVTIIFFFFLILSIVFRVHFTMYFIIIYQIYIVKFPHKY